MNRWQALVSILIAIQFPLLIIGFFLAVIGTGIDDSGSSTARMSVFVVVLAMFASAYCFWRGTAKEPLRRFDYPFLVIALLPSLISLSLVITWYAKGQLDLS